jgi:phage repressor protein C with HTH and peptisase S24 domain
MPILGASVGGDSRTRTLFNGQRLGDVTRPASLANNPRAYATYVHGESMEPRYEAGEIVLVNPDKGYRKGNYVVAQVYENDGDPPFGYVKRFVSFGDELVLEQLNPPEGEDRLMRFPRDRVVAVHRIVGTLDE